MLVGALDNFGSPQSLRSVPLGGATCKHGITFPTSAWILVANETASTPLEPMPLNHVYILHLHGAFKGSRSSWMWPGVIG
jgi:hypothetical protein